MPGYSIRGTELSAGDVPWPESRDLVGLIANAPVSTFVKQLVSFGRRLS